MAARIDGLRSTHEWLVLERDDQIIGFACGQPLKRLAAFRWSPETGIYVDVDHDRAGAGRELFSQLLRRLTERGYRQAFAGITQTQRGQQQFPSILRVPGRRLVPTRGMETGQLARRGVECNSICRARPNRMEHLARPSNRRR
jgi:GNAT superfamily N-acetyltransferase